jgi:hypothetical protein
VTARFADECETLSLNAADYEVATWEVTYSDTHRGMSRGRKSFSAMNESPLIGAAYSASAPIELVSGQAQVSVNLNVGFRHKGI